MPPLQLSILLFLQCKNYQGRDYLFYCMECNGVIPICPVSSRCICVSWQLPFSYRIAQKKVGSGSSLFGSSRMCQSNCNLWLFLFFFPLVLSVICQMLLPESPGVLIPDNGRSCRESRGSRFITSFSVNLLLSIMYPLLSLELESKP